MEVKMPKLFRNILLVLLFLSLSLTYALALEEIAITTYYPSPYGSYNELRSKRMAIGDDYLDSVGYTWEAADGDGGEVDYQADLVVEGRVGVGTVTPTVALDVNGTVNATAFQVGGTAGKSGTTTLTVRDAGGSADCTITVINGIITASTC
jgi:hypothetical protein